MYTNSNIQNLLTLFAYPVSIPILVVLTVYFGRIAYTDYRSGKIEDWWNLVFVVGRLLVVPIYGLGAEHLIAGVLLSLIFLIPAMIFNHQSGGDIKSAVVVGLWLGEMSYVFMLFSVALGYILSHIYFRFKGRLSIPFGITYLFSHIVFVLVQFLA